MDLFQYIGSEETKASLGSSEYTEIAIEHRHHFHFDVFKHQNLDDDDLGSLILKMKSAAISCNQSSEEALYFPLSNPKFKAFMFESRIYLVNADEKTPDFINDLGPQALRKSHLSDEAIQRGKEVNRLFKRYKSKEGDGFSGMIEFESYLKTGVLPQGYPNKRKWEVEPLEFKKVNVEDYKKKHGVRTWSAEAKQKNQLRIVKKKFIGGIKEVFDDHLKFEIQKRIDDGRIFMDFEKAYDQIVCELGW